MPLSGIDFKDVEKAILEEKDLIIASSLISTYDEVSQAFPILIRYIVRKKTGIDLYQFNIIAKVFKVDDGWVDWFTIDFVNREDTTEHYITTFTFGYPQDPNEDTDD